MKAERDFHIFYQICSGEKPAINDLLLVSLDPTEYKYCSQGEVKVASINDKEELNATDESFDILGFSEDEKNGIYMITGRGQNPIFSFLKSVCH